MEERDEAAHIDNVNVGKRVVQDVWYRTEYEVGMHAHLTVEDILSWMEVCFILSCYR